MADVMTGVPSIVMGLFVATIWVSAGLHFGYSGFAGSLALGALMLPIVIRSCEEMLKLVPDDLRQASDALGRTPLAHGRVGRAPRRAPRHRERRDARRRRAPRARPRRCCSRSASRATSTPTRSTERTPRCRRRSGSTRRRRSRRRKDRAWGAALTLIVIVFVLHGARAGRLDPLLQRPPLTAAATTPARRRGPTPG